MKKIAVTLAAIATLATAAFAHSGALLHKSADGRTAPVPGQTYPATFVTGMPSAV
jgi:uncharacterized GH25 family protein